MKPILSTPETRRLDCWRRANAPDLHESGFDAGVYATAMAVRAAGPSATIEQMMACSVGQRGPRPSLTVRCDGCNAQVAAAVMVGEVPDYESSTATLCEQCLVTALDALREATK